MMYFVRCWNVLFHMKHFADLNCDLVTGTAYNGRKFCTARYSQGSGSSMDENEALPLSKGHILNGTDSFLALKMARICGCPGGWVYKSRTFHSCAWDFLFVQ
jgi:hypothetical protein